MDILSEMEIEFELEDSDLVFTFEPWNDRNHSGRKVLWKVPNGSYSGTLADMFDDIPVQSSRTRTIYPLGDM